LNSWDEDVMNHLLADFRLLLRDLPVQMPSEFAFLGRAVSTLTGVLYSIDPKLDLFELGKPIVLDWLEENNRDEVTGTHFGKQWFQALSRTLISLPKRLDALLDEPKLLRQQQERHHKEKRHTDYKRWSRHYSFVFFLLGVISTLGALLLEHHLFFIGSSIVLLIGLISFFISSRKLQS
jgi:predicted unusual protein kinase regulating ubiquinone biosynthesis (AarF/ABC1/UbiB family)